MLKQIIIPLLLLVIAWLWSRWLLSSSSRVHLDLDDLDHLGWGDLKDAVLGDARFQLDLAVLSLRIRRHVADVKLADARVVERDVVGKTVASFDLEWFAFVDGEKFA